MPITVKHGGGLAGTAAGQIIAQAGQADLARQQQTTLAAQQISASRDAQMRDIDARSGLQKQAADDAMKRVALQAGLGKEMQEQEYDMEVQKMQEAAKIEANQLEWKIGAEGRRKIAQFNNERMAVQGASARGEITPEQAEAALFDIQRRQSGVANPQAYPADPNKPPPQRKQTWVSEESGALMGIGKDGPEVKVQPDKMPAYLEKQAQQKERAAALVARQKYEDELWNTKRKTSKKNAQTGVSEESEEFISPNEIKERLNERYGPPPSQQQQQQQQRDVAREVGGVWGYNPDEAMPQQQQQQQGEPAAPEGQWWTAVEAPSKEFPDGVPVSESRKRLPPKTGIALSFFDAFSKKFGSYDKIPKHLLPAFDEILEEVKRYRADQKRR